MNIKFSTIRYWHLQDGNVNILFDSTEETKLFFNGGNFSMSGDVHNACYSTYNIKSHEKTHVINNIKETEDFDFILQIDDTIYMKIFLCQMIHTKMVLYKLFVYFAQQIHFTMILFATTMKAMI